MTMRLSAGWKPAAGAGLVFLLLAIAWHAPSSLSPASAVPDLGDPLHLGYVMAWDAHQLVRRPWALYDSNSFFPYPRSLAFGDHLLPEALLVAPINWATGNAVLASNVGVVLALALSGLAMFLLVRQLTGSWGAGLASGLVYAFNSFTRHELLRIHVLNLQWWPLALLFLDRFVRSGRRRDALGLAIAMTLQGLSGTYYLLYSLLVGPLWLAGVYALARRLPTRAEAARLAGALAVAGAPAVVLLLPYAAQFQAMGFEKSWTGGADVLSYLDPGASWVWGSIALPGRASEVPHFLGYLGLFLMAAGAVRVLRAPAARPIGAVALATAAIGFVLSLGPAIVLGGRQLCDGPYRFLYDHVRLIRGMASPERIGVLAILGGAIAAGFGVEALLARAAPRGRPALLAALAALLVLEHASPPQPAEPVPAGAALPSVYAWLADAGGDPLVELPVMGERQKRLRAAYLYFSTRHWRPIPIGRTSFYPPAHDWLAWQLRHFPDATSLTLLERLGIRTLVVHPHAWTDAERPGQMAALEAEPRLRLVRRFDDPPDPRFAALGLGEERVYTIVGEGPPPASLCTPADELPRGDWTFEHSGRKKPDLARDGDRRTAWFTHIPQRPGDFFDVTLPREDTVAAVAIDLYYPHEEFPRNPQILVSDDREDWRQVPYLDGPDARWAVLDDLLRRPREAQLVFRIAPQRLRSLSLRIAGRERDDAWPQWSIPELRLYRTCRSSSSSVWAEPSP